MVDLTIVCPTHGRAGSVSAFEVFGDDLLLCVAESQAPLYRAAYPDAKLDVHGDDVVGLGPKMTWMYEKYGAMFRIDDDAKRMRDQTDNGKRVEPARARDIVRRTADQAHDMGAYLFGVSGEPIPRHFLPQDPFRLTGMIDGGKSGFLPDAGFWWPDDIAFADDFWIATWNAWKHRFCLVDERYVIPTLGASRGGLSNVRTVSAIWKKAEFLTESFGDAVSLKDRKNQEVSTGTRAVPTISSGTMTATYPWRLKVPW